MSEQAKKHSSAAGRDGSGFLGSVLGRRSVAPRAASPSGDGSGAPSVGISRPRLALFAALAAAFILLVASALAAAASELTIEAAPGSTGEGTVTGTGANSPINCHIVGETASGECTSDVAAFEELTFEATGEGARFVEWSADGELEFSVCNETPTTNPCTGGWGFGGTPTTLTAKFEEASAPELTIEAAPGSTGEGTVTGTRPPNTLSHNCNIVGETASGECTSDVAAFEELKFEATGENGANSSSGAPTENSNSASATKPRPPTPAPAAGASAARPPP